MKFLEGRVRRGAGFRVEKEKSPVRVDHSKVKAIKWGGGGCGFKAARGDRGGGTIRGQLARAQGCVLGKADGQTDVQGI